MIPVNEPIVTKRAIKYVNEALKTAWISSAGKYVEQFEKNFANYLGVKYASSCTNGTTALHLAIRSLDIKKGDEVIMPDQTIISCPLSVIYEQAKPVFVDVEPDTANIDPKLIEEKITAKTKAIMVVHLYGHTADMDPILKIAKKHKLYVIEDASQAHGAEYKAKKAGSLGDIATYSFYGNKIVTTGEGGMVVTNNKKFYDKCNLYKDLGHKVGRRFYHEEIAYNYRLTNLQAALGVAHLEDIDKFIDKKLKMAKLYQKGLKKLNWIRLPAEKNYAKNVYWMYNIILKDNAPFTREEFMSKLKKKGVDTRTYFYPLHRQPVITKLYKYNTHDFPVNNKLSKQGLYLPSGLAITNQQIKKVVETIYEISR
ncbi:MAG: DegT/DnrJ/EryC1/StrS family aminotransferase [Candidatus Woesebacteria bacterium]|jgi:perosamine synthetase